MKAFLLALVLVTSGLLSVRAQDPSVEPPKVGRPVDFSQLVGMFQIKAEAAPVQVAVEEPIVLTVTIAGNAVDPHVPRREALRIFPANWPTQFFMEPAGEESRSGMWIFRYRIRPKHEQVKMVPSLKLVYYTPRQRRYQTAYTDAIPLTVTPRPAPNLAIPGVKVIKAPASFLELAEVGQEAPSRPWEPSLGTWLAIGLAPPLTCMGAAWLWQRRGDAERARERRRHEATRRILAALTENHADAEAMNGLLAEFLRQRLDFPALEATPAEIERYLKRQGVAKELRQRYRRWFQGCDAARFAPGTIFRKDDVAAEARLLVQALEEQPCVAGR